MRRRLHLLLSVIRTSILAVVVVWVAFRGVGVAYRRFTDEEIARVVSPDGRVDAVILRADPGAMNSFAYFLYIVTAGQHVRDYPWWLGGDEPLLSGEDFEEDHLRVAWAERVLDITYLRVRIASFVNIWTDWRINDAKYTVELRLRPRTPAAADPPGASTSMSLKRTVACG